MNISHPSTKTSDDRANTLDPFSASDSAPLGKYIALKVFFHSLFIQSSFNYHGMQNLGVAFSLLPFAMPMRGDTEHIASLFSRHLQLFNTNPCLSGPIVGSILHMEEAYAADNDEQIVAEVVNLKNALMGPYAAMGDSFFWGALKPLAAVISVFIALQHRPLAPLAFLILYNPPHIWIRCRGFMEGYRRGRKAIEFIKIMDMPEVTGRIRWISLAVLGGLAAYAGRFTSQSTLGLPLDLVTKSVVLLLILLCFWGIKNGISQVDMLYLVFIMGCVVSL